MRGSLAVPKQAGSPTPTQSVPRVPDYGLEHRAAIEGWGGVPAMSARCITA